MFINNILKAIILLVFLFFFNWTGYRSLWSFTKQQENRWKKIMLIQNNLNINETQFTVYGIMSCLLTEDINRSQFYTFKITGKVPCLHTLTRHLTYPKYLSVTLKSDLKGQYCSKTITAATVHQVFHSMKIKFCMTSLKKLKKNKPRCKKK